MTHETDDQFTETTITKIEEEPNGWAVTWDEGACLYVPREGAPITPEVGMTAQVYPDTMAGSRVRGLVIGGKVFWYRTETEGKQHHADLMYGKDAADLLRKWDAGDVVHTIEMGGLGPGYEQVIHIVAFEILRHLLAEQYDSAAWTDKDAWSRDLDKIDKAMMGLGGISDLGMSGAQWGAAVKLATAFYMRGPQQCLSEVPSDRHTMVSKHFPQAPAA